MTFEYKILMIAVCLVSTAYCFETDYWLNFLQFWQSGKDNADNSSREKRQVRGGDTCTEFHLACSQTYVKIYVTYVIVSSLCVC